jgi:hypothetical protein
VCVPQPNPACIVITPNDVDFGTVQTGCRSAVTTFQLRNVCAFSVTLSALGIAGSGFSTAGLTTPSTLAANGTATFTVTFAPTTVGRVDSILVVGATHSSSTFAYQTPVTGNGAATGLNQDRFPIPTKTDVVLIVDDSCSMSSYQAALGSNANAFLAYAFSANVDFNLGVTTTTMDDPQFQGRFVGPTAQKVLRSTTPNLLTVFNQRVNVGTAGSASEFMCDPAVAALTPALLTTTNANFLRGDAALSVLAFTDAYDHSASGVAEYLRRLQAVKGQRRRNQFSFSSVAPTFPTAPSGCSSYDTSGLSAATLRDMAAGSGGLQTEICTVSNTQTWRTEATRLGQAVFGGRGTWFLTGRPAPATAGSLTVTLNGVTVPELSANLRNWSYDATRNAVVFEARSLPAPGQTVGIDYAVACMP